MSLMRKYHLNYKLSTQKNINHEVCEDIENASHCVLGEEDKNFIFTDLFSKVGTVHAFMSYLCPSNILKYNNIPFFFFFFASGFLSQ